MSAIPDRTNVRVRKLGSRLSHGIVLCEHRSRCQTTPGTDTKTERPKCSGYWCRPSRPAFCATALRRPSRRYVRRHGRPAPRLGDDATADDATADAVAPFTARTRRARDRGPLAPVAARTSSGLCIADTSDVSAIDVIRTPPSLCCLHAPCDFQQNIGEIYCGSMLGREPS